MALTYNIEKDMEIGRAALSKSLLQNAAYPVREIASFAGVHVVDKVKKQIL